jgi:hypothetical protein
MAAAEMQRCKSGIVVRTDRVIMRAGTYPKGWITSDNAVSGTSNICVDGKAVKPR